MTREELTHPVAAAATTQVKLCPYDEEEPHIWFRLIEARSQRQGSDPKNLSMPMLWLSGQANTPPPSGGFF